MPAGRWAVATGCPAVLMALLVSCASGEQTGGAGPASAAPVTSASNTAQPSPSPVAGTRSPHPVTTVLVTDDPAVSAAGPSAAGAWPAELATQLADAGAPLQLDIAADPSAGFSADTSFTDLVTDRVARSTQLVVFSETRFGGASAADVRQGAEDAFAAVEESAPDALIVVIAPWSPTADVPAPGEDIRNAVRAAAAGAEVAVTYVDPVTEGWATGMSPQQVAASLLPDVAPLVTDLTRSGAFD